MHITTVSLQRNKVAIQSGIAVQVDNMSTQTALELGGQSPYNSYWIYTLGGPVSVLHGDLLIDTKQVDPVTGNPVQYRVFGEPEVFDFSHTEIPAEKLIGV